MSACSIMGSRGCTGMQTSLTYIRTCREVERARERERDSLWWGMNERLEESHIERQLQGGMQAIAEKY